MARVSSSPNFGEYCTVSEAAQFLGVSKATLRNWDRTGKLKPRRHPHNGYRIYLHEDLEAVLRSTDHSPVKDELLAPVVQWSTMSDSDHFVQFYETDEFLAESVSGFVAAALTAGDCSIVIATPEHKLALNEKLAAWGLDVPAAIKEGRFVALDASETLGQLMVGEAPDRQRFLATVGEVVGRVAAHGRRIHAFGEMVALLWAEGNREGAIRLETLWNELAKVHRFTLFCAYPVDGFGESGDEKPLEEVCGCHSKVIPAESYSLLASPETRLTEIALLQQKARSHDAEIKHRQQVEHTLARRQRELTDFFEKATEGLHRVGADGTVLWANKAEANLLGYSVDEYVGRPITDFHADQEVIEQILSRLKRGETLANFPARLKCKDGSIKHVRINSSACFEDGQFAYTRCFTRDVTQEWISENALREADRRKDEFLATLAHELRNPLAPIKNGLAIMAMNEGDPASLGEIRSIMERQVGQLIRLVNDLLDIGRISRDKIQLHKERVDLASIVRCAVETSRPVIDAARHDLAIKVPHAPVYVEADRTRMSQVLSNLLNNSAKYTNPGGRIEIEVSRERNQAVIAVRDNGVGIACDALAYIFDMFRQVDRSLEQSQGGLGIGLTLVRRLVELHGGTVTALSEGPGKGSEFIVRVPMSASQGDEATASPALPQPSRDSKRILVVDDNRDAGETLAHFLILQGHQVLTAKDGFEAIEVTETFRPDVVLMDVGMPRLNGYEATRRLRQLEGGKDLKIVALTGWGQASDVRLAQEAGCNAHLVKPVDFDSLNALIEQAAARNR